MEPPQLFSYFGSGLKVFAAHKLREQCFPEDGPYGQVTANGPGGEPGGESHQPVILHEREQPVGPLEFNIRLVGKGRFRIGKRQWGGDRVVHIGKAATAKISEYTLKNRQFAH